MEISWTFAAPDNWVIVLGFIFAIFAGWFSALVLDK